jgi:hypothetical protein
LLRIAKARTARRTGADAYLIAGGSIQPGRNSASPAPNFHVTQYPKANQKSKFIMKKAKPKLKTKH